MKTIVFFVASLLCTNLLYSQEVNQDSLKQSIKDEKDNKARILEEKFKIVKQLLDSKKFIVKANILSDKRGYQQSVNGRFNFLVVDTAQSTVQFADDSGIGPYGVNSTTSKGYISGWKLKVDERHKTASIWMNIVTFSLIFNVYINVNIDGDVVANFTSSNSLNFTMRGKLVPLKESGVYIGHHL